MLKHLKHIALKLQKRSRFAKSSTLARWRNNRLLILCYHGISTSDEHLWNPELYMTAEQLESRLIALRRAGCQVLPLSDGVKALYDRTLPPKSVCLTFDDGFQDFSRMAVPVLRKYRMPATVYLTSFYSKFQRPVFDVMSRYLLWRGRAGEFCNGLIGDTGYSDLGLEAHRTKLATRIKSYTANFTAEAKDRFLLAMAESLGIDYNNLVAKRTLQLMNASELSALDDSIQIELHTHRHRAPLDEALFVSEIAENRRYIFEATHGRVSARHFCYPSGVVNSAFGPRLQALGIRSATTCELGLASRSHDPFELPRVLDTSNVSDLEFEAWVSGVASFLPRRKLAGPTPTFSGVLDQEWYA